MFEREHHRRVASVLEALDVHVLEDNACYFGGGTALALKHGEYRDSLDIDFLVSDVKGYRTLRNLMRGDKGLAAVMRADASLMQTREIRVDQYGIRTMIKVHDVEIKFEIVLEGRISFDVPERTERICGVATLSALDMAASKLLANSARWADDSVHSRDVIDLAMMQPTKKMLRFAVDKAKGAYGASIERDLDKAVDALATRRGRLLGCMQALQMLDVPRGLQPIAPAVLWKRIRRLRQGKTPS